jgi:integral membrane protein (TIGR01906 family)
MSKHNKHSHDEPKHHQAHSDNKIEKNHNLNHKKILDYSIITLFSISLIIIIIFGSLNLMIFNKDFYYSEYTKNGVYDTLASQKGIDSGTVDDITGNILKYFKNDAELKYFSPAEKSHMADVKYLIRTMQYIYYSAAAMCILLFFFCYKRYQQDKYSFIKILGKSMLYSSIAAVAFLILVFVTAVFSFDLLFTTFHLALFPQGNWTFSSSTLLISLFPQQFFFDMSLRIFIFAMSQAIIFFGIGYWITKQIKNYEKHGLK